MTMYLSYLELDPITGRPMRPPQARLLTPLGVYGLLALGAIFTGAALAFVS